jgi:hypothetical protein
VADAMEPLGEGVEQEAPDELVGSERSGDDDLMPQTTIVQEDGR